MGWPVSAKPSRRWIVSSDARHINSCCHVICSSQCMVVPDPPALMLPFLAQTLPVFFHSCPTIHLNWSSLPCLQICNLLAFKLLSWLSVDIDMSFHSCFCHLTSALCFASLSLHHGGIKLSLLLTHRCSKNEEPEDLSLILFSHMIPGHKPHPACWERSICPVEELFLSALTSGFHVTWQSRLQSAE